MDILLRRKRVAKQQTPTIDGQYRDAEIHFMGMSEALQRANTQLCFISLSDTVLREGDTLPS